MPKRLTKSILFLGAFALSASAAIIGLRADSALAAVAVLGLGVAIVYVAASWISMADILTAAAAALVALICGAFSFVALKSGEVAVGLSAMGFVIIAGFWIAHLTDRAVERRHDGKAQ